MENCLSLLHDRNRLVSHPAGSPDLEEDDFRWIKWSLERHRAASDNPMTGVISTDDFIELSDINDDVLIRLSTALDSDCWVNRQRSVRFTKTMSNLRKHITPIIRYAKKVTLIDPYMTCREERFFDTVQTIADLLGRYDGHQEPGVVHIHAGDPRAIGQETLQESVEDRLNRWETELKPVVSHWQHKFRISLWGRKPNGKHLHDRYLITDQCGFDVPGGLDFLPDDDEARANQTTWSLLEYVDVQKIVWEEYHHSKSPYRYLGSRTVIPSQQ